MKFKISTKFYGRLLCLPYILIFISCEVNKNLNLSNYEFSIYDSLVIKINPSTKLDLYQTHSRSDTLIISAADHKEKKLYLFYILSDSLLKTKVIQLNFLERDEFPYVIYTYSDYFNAYIVYRDQKEVDYNWNNVFYFVKEDVIKKIKPKLVI